MDHRPGANPALPGVGPQLCGLRQHRGLHLGHPQPEKNDDAEDAKGSDSI
jgi:hypothetical protein